VDVVDLLNRLGGVGDARVLFEATSRAAVEAAVQSGLVLHVSRGKYALPTAYVAYREAARLSGVITGASAAAVHGWELKAPPDLPSITVPAKRKVDKARRVGVDLHWRDIPPEHVRRGVLLPGPTVIDCARTRPFDEALSVADSALRHDDVTKPHLLRLAEALPGRGRSRALRVVREATGLAANPLESTLRALGLGVAGLHLRPQVLISEGGWSGRPDLVDRELRLVVEAESFEFHGHRGALLRDCRRYTALVLLGWTVVRFCWEDVMFSPEYVAESLRILVEQLSSRARRGGAGAQGQVIVPKPGLSGR
jgi:very-short-patch-repair endonuclease